MTATARRRRISEHQFRSRLCEAGEQLVEIGAYRPPPDVRRCIRILAQLGEAIDQVLPSAEIIVPSRKPRTRRKRA